LVREKGFDLVISAFASVAERFPRLSLFIIGDGPERSMLERQATALGLTRSVAFTGAIPNDRVPELLNTATFVVVPSRYREPFPLVALEAAQMARPVIATDMGGLPESVVDGETGLLITLEDSTALVDAMVFLLEHPEIATKMGLAGRSRVLATFTMDNFVDAYGTLYQRLAMTKHNTPSVYEDDASFDTRG
jgi:glycogen(starch) synthase